MNDKHCVTPDKLRWTCDCRKLGFETTEELGDLAAAIGQDRAMDALEFGVRINSDGFNIFVLGPVGTGRNSMARKVLDKVATGRPAPGDWCYVHNFDSPNEPQAIDLPGGMAPRLRADMDELIEDVQREIASAFESEDYIERRDETLREFREMRQAELEAFEREAQRVSMVVGRGPAGIIVAPAKDGEVMSPQEYGELEDDERRALDNRRERLQEKLDEILRKHHRKEKQARAKVKRLDQEVARFAVGNLFEDLRTRYADHQRIVEHLRRIEADIIENIEALKSRDDDGPQAPFPFPFPMPASTGQSHYERYRVNVLLTRHPRGGAPVVYESNPTIDNLTGQIEHRTQMGALVTDFTMIRPGALHRANGGFLLLEAEAVLRRPYAWEALKRALKNRLIRIESLQDQLRFMSTVTLEPEPVPLNLKVVLVGTPYIYYLLYAYDDDFGKLFKVKADFDTSTKRTARVLKRYGRFIATVCREEGLSHFDAEAVGLVIEYAARLVSDQVRLSTRFQAVADLVREAAYWSGHNGNSIVTAADVQRAIDEHVARSNRIEERLGEMVERDLIMLTFDGETVGQVNGLSVVPLGDYWFGRPSRVTARTFVGKGGVTQIDREAKLTGRIHDKGVLILSGFLGERYGRDKPLTLAASLTFEQTYDTIEGDSASSVELYALLSSLADTPIRQGIAVTGSVNQFGQVQAVGGVNEKIEGFYRACAVRGLTGEQGVIIPKANVQNLMLNREVVEAVQEGKFHVWAVATVDEGFEVLTGGEMGRRRKDGAFPPGTINHRVQETLDRFAEAYDRKSSDNNNDKAQGSRKS